MLMDHAQAILVAREVGPAAGIDQKPGVKLLGLPVLPPRLHYHVGVIVGNLRNSPAFSDFRPRSGCVFEQKMVEGGALDLESCGLPSEPAIPEDQLERLAAVAQIKLGSALDCEAGRLENRHNAHVMEDTVIVGQQGFADVEPGEMLLFQEQHASTVAGEKGCSSTAARPAANHQGIIGRLLHTIMTAKTERISKPNVTSPLRFV